MERLDGRCGCSCSSSGWTRADGADVVPIARRCPISLGDRPVMVLGGPVAGWTNGHAFCAAS